MPAWRRGTYDSGHCGLSWLVVGLVFIALVYTLDDVFLARQLCPFRLIRSSWVKDQSERVAALQRVDLRHNHRHKR